MIKKSFNFLAGALLSLSILLPTAMTAAKAVLLLLTLLVAMTLLFRGGSRLTPAVWILSLIYVCSGLLWSLYGLLKGTPGAIAVLTVMGVYPLIFTLLASAYRASDGEKLRQLFTALAITLTIFNILYIVGFVIAPHNPLQQLIEGMYQDEAVVDAADTYFKFTIPNISSCIFLLPFLATSFIHSSRRRLLIGTAILGMLIIMLLSGRRGFALAAASGLLIAYLITFKPHLHPKFTIRLNPSVLAALFATTVGLIWFFSSFYGAEFYLDQIKSIFNFSTNESNIERSRQFDSMMLEFFKSPIFGAGAGAAAQYNRSIEQPWAYELAYVGFLFQYGLLGFLLYACGILLLIAHLVRRARQHGRNTFEFSYLAGFIAFMIANSTNPYLAKFDYMWLLFIPVAIMNHDLLYKHEKNRIGRAQHAAE